MIHITQSCRGAARCAPSRQERKSRRYFRSEEKLSRTVFQDGVRGEIASKWLLPWREQRYETSPKLTYSSGLLQRNPGKRPKSRSVV